MSPVKKTRTLTFKTNILLRELRRLRALNKKIMSTGPVFLPRKGEPDLMALGIQKDWAMRLMGESFHESFVACGGINYVTSLMTAPMLAPDGDVVQYEITVWKVGKKTAHQLRVEAERDRDAALAELLALRAGLGLVGSATDRAKEPLPPKLAPIEPSGKAPDVTSSHVLYMFNRLPHYLRCAHCGAEQPLPEAFDTDTVLAMVGVFKSKHEGCEAPRKDVSSNPVGPT